MIKKAAPPPLPASKGNFQIFPKPTALPAAAAMNPNLLENLLLLCAILHYSIPDQFETVRKFQRNDIDRYKTSNILFFGLIIAL